MPPIPAPNAPANTSGIGLSLRVHVYRTHSTSGLKVLSGLWLALSVRNKTKVEGHLKVIFQTTLWFSFILTQPTY